MEIKKLKKPKKSSISKYRQSDYNNAIFPEEGKKMSKRVFSCENKTVNEYGDKIMLYYILYENDTNNADFNGKTFSVEVQMYTQYPDARTSKEAGSVPDMFTDASEAVAFVKKICEMLVTPGTIADIAYDYITEKAM